MIDLFFTEELNISVQKGDFVFATPLTSQSSYNVPSSNFTGSNVFVGVVEEVDRPDKRIRVDNSSTGLVPTSGDYIAFAKDNQTNASSIKGYYAATTFTNNSRQKAELFAVGAEIQQSSK
jgi:hypothetical protein